MIFVDWIMLFLLLFVNIVFWWGFFRVVGDVREIRKAVADINYRLIK